jgi:predicted transcriptional regulator
MAETAKPGWRYMGFKLPTKLAAKLQARARKNEVTMTSIVKQALRAYLRKGKAGC